MKLTKEYLKNIIKEELNGLNEQQESLPLNLHGELQDGTKFSLEITKFNVWHDDESVTEPTNEQEYLNQAIRTLQSAINPNIIGLGEDPVQQ